MSEEQLWLRKIVAFFNEWFNCIYRPLYEIKMTWIVILQLSASLAIYFTLSYFAMLDVRHHPYPHDFFDITLPKNWIIKTVANVLPVISVLYRLLSGKNRALCAKRAALMYLLKGIVQFVTIIPAVNGIEDCINRTAGELILFGDNCADMMFSGHTGLTMLMLPQRWRSPWVLLVGIALKLSRMHYTSDILIAIIVVWQIEHWIVEVPTLNRSTRESKTMRESRTMLISKNVITTV
jgi:hypothetical protein